MVIAVATTSSIVSGIKLSGILTSFNAVDDASSSCGRSNLTGVRIFPTLSRRRFSSIGAVSPIRGDAQSSFSRR